MRILLSLSLATLVSFAVSGCVKSSYQKNADAAEEMIGIFDEYSTALESVKDSASAKAAAAKISSANKRMRALAKSLKDLPKVTKSDKEKLDKEYLPKIKAATDRFTRAAFKAGRHARGEPSLVSAMKEMETIAKSARGFGR